MTVHLCSVLELRCFFETTYFWPAAGIYVNFMEKYPVGELLLGKFQACMSTSLLHTMLPITQRASSAEQQSNNSLRLIFFTAACYALAVIQFIFLSEQHGQHTDCIFKKGCFERPMLHCASGVERGCLNPRADLQLCQN